jgi:aldose 1-epimerase
MVGRAQNRVSLALELRPSPAYPFALGLTVEYRLGRDGLTVVIDADNLGESDLPFGIGFHPYLTVGTPTVDQVRLTVPSRQRLFSDDGACPPAVVLVRGPSSISPRAA